MEKNIEQSESSNFEGTKHIDVAGLCKLIKIKNEYEFFYH